MASKKACVKSVITVILTLAALIAALICFGYGVGAEELGAKAATETSGKWLTTGKTENLIPEILSTDTWNSLVEKGWTKDSGTPNLEVYLTDGYGYGVRPVDRGTGADIGNDKAPYGGICYTVILSEADRVKANAGQLSISASASYYRQSTASVDLTLRAEFHGANGVDISTADVVSETGGSSPATLTLNLTEVPQNTEYIEMWFSNSKSLLDRPWIAQMQAYLHDSTAPSAVSSALVENTDIADRGGAIAGDTVQYSITFNEKISVANPGTATIDVAGTSVASDSYAVTDNGGISTLTYSFGIPEVANNGTIKFSGVSGATVMDEAGNASDITYKDIPGTLNYYAEASVTVNCSGLTYSGATTAKLGTNATITLSPDRGYQLPTAVTVTIGGAQVTNSYSYNAANGQITVNGAYIKGDIVVTASGVAVTVTATFDKQSGAGGTDTVTATFDSAMPQISCPTRTGYTFRGYFSARNGGGTQYYDQSGNSVKNCDFDTATTLYAYWTANTYTITYNPNKPAAASGTVSGATENSSHTYDTEKALTNNGYSLVGWTFTGWATSSTGAKEYNDNQSVENLTATNGATVTLYAVWTANTYTVTYNSNKPAAASGQISGSTASSSHTYDTEKVLSANGYSLTGWTFAGWANSSTGAKEYNDNQSVKNLTAAGGGTVTLYAVWTANTYTVTYNSNKPATASGEISGTTANSEHTYDTEKTLSANGYSLVGWTFAGWSTSSTGAKAYDNGQSVENLTYTNGETVTLYAAWTANTYTVTYDANKPAIASENITGSTVGSSHVYDTLSPLTDNGFTLTGWTFSGWNTLRNGEGTAYANGQNVATLSSENGGSVTLYAVWTANTYTVTYNSNKPAAASGEISGTTASSEHTYDSEKALTSNGYSLVGWTFAGWATSAEDEKAYNDSQTVKNLTATNGATVTLYAVWTANTYTVTYNSNKPAAASGTVSGATENSSHIYDTENTLTSNGYSLVGWTFAGWTNSSTGAKAYDNGQSVENLTSTNGETVTLYAVWTANTYAVTYNSNKPATASGEISGTTASSEHTYDIEKTLTANGYSLVGWTFAGWATSAEDEKAYNDNQSVKNLTAASGGSVTLYAVWTANEYTLFYNSAGGAGAGSNKVHYDGALPELNIVPTRNGYNFSGYFDKADGDGTLYYDAEGRPAEAVKYLITGDLTVYAYWQPITYTVTLYSEGNYIGALECTFGSLTLPSAEALSLTRKNYDFVGWNIYDEQNWSMYSADKEYKVGLTTEQGAEVTLYAAWLERPVHLLGFDPSGGTGAPAMTTIHEGETITLTEQKPYRENHTFAGWAKTAEGEAEYFPGGEFTMGDSACTLYAVWKKNPALSYDANGGEFYSEVNVTYPASGESVALISVIPHREGYGFVGWALDAQALAEDCLDVLEMPTEDTVLYAVWEKLRFTVTVSAPEGYAVEGVSNGEEAEFGSAISFTVTGANASVFVNGVEAKAADGIYSFVLACDTEIRVSDGTELFLLYSANGGSGAPVDSGSYMSGASAVVARADNIVREGYSFLGWSLDESAVTPTLFEGDGIEFTDSTVTLYAVWEANVYYVKYYSEGTLSDVVSAFGYDETNVLAANVFEKTGHTFVGWATAEDGEAVYSDGAAICNLTAEDEAEVFLYAVWKSTVTTVSFDLGGGTEGSESMAIAFGTVPATETVLPPVKKGYVFLGYFTAPEGGVRVFDENMNLVNSLNGYSYAISMFVGAENGETNWLLNEENVTLYAVYAGVNYTVVYIDGNDEAGRQSAVYGEAFELLSAETLNITAPEYHSFAGWSVVPEGVVAYADGQRITNGLAETEGAEFYLYTVFKENEKIRVFYDGNGGMNAPVDKTYYYVGTEIALSAVIPEKEGYIFSGWGYDTESAAFTYADGAFTPATFSATEDVRLYAIWTAGELLQSQIDGIRASVEEINSAIEALNTEDTELSGQIIALADRLTAAEEAIQSPDDTFATDEELAAAIAELRSILEAADTALQNAIDTVQSNLDSAVAELEGSISGEVGTLNEKLTALDTAYKAADALVNSDIAALKVADTEIKASIAALDTAYKAADTALQNAIDTVQSNLDSAVAELKGSIAGEVGTLNEKLTALDTAYKAADTLINSDIAALKEADTEIKASIAALDTAYKAADTALQNAIDTVQSNLDNAVSELEGSIAGEVGTLNEKLTALDTAYKAADTLINSDIAALKVADTEIKASIAALDIAYKAADTALQNAIETVQSNLDSAITELREADAGNYEELNAKLQNFEKAYKEADLVLGEQIGMLSEASAALIKRVEALERLFESSAAMSGDIAELKRELAAAKEALEASDDGLRDALDELDKIGENRAEAYLAVSIVLGIIVVALLAVILYAPVKQLIRNIIERRKRKKS